MKRDDYGLEGFRVAVLSLPGGVYERPPADFHAIGLNVGSPAHIVARRDGYVHESVHELLAVDIVPAGMPAQWELEWPAGANEILSLQVTAKFLQRVAEQCEMNSNQIEVINKFSMHDLQIAHLGLLLKADLEAGGLGGWLYGESLATALGVHILRRHTVSPQSIPEVRGGLSQVRLRRATEYIQAHLEERIGLTGLAEAVGLGSSQFRALFKQSTGLAPHQYIITQRVERAKQLLLRGGLTVGEAASAAGFADQSHLNRHMRRLLGITPRRLLDR